jgi:hypothetical protein
VHGLDHADEVSKCASSAIATNHSRITLSAEAKSSGVFVMHAAEHRLRVQPDRWRVCPVVELIPSTPVYFVQIWHSRGDKEETGSLKS